MKTDVIREDLNTCLSQCRNNSNLTEKISLCHAGCLDAFCLEKICYHFSCVCFGCQ